MNILQTYGAADVLAFEGQRAMTVLVARAVTRVSRRLGRAFLRALAQTPPLPR